MPAAPSKLPTPTLTSLSSCAGCAAKLRPDLLAELLAGLPKVKSKQVLVGYDTSDDAAVYQLSKDQAVVETVDFFPPVVDDPYAYGQINEISDHTFHKKSGWAHAGLLSLDVPHMPEKYRNSVIFGSIHGCSVKQNILKPNGSTFVGSEGDDFLVSGDKNFRPINIRWGPNGDIYLIQEKDVRRFILEHPTDIDLRKVDQLWFLDLLTNGLVRAA